MSERPSWIKVRAPTAKEADGMRGMRDVLHRHRLTTICQGALCPNAVECWGAHTATFLLLGETCTRTCRFCGVPSGNPRTGLDADEPGRVANAAAELGLRHVVLTSVDRDDLPDGGAAAFAETIRRVKAAGDGITVEALIPDFAGEKSPLEVVLSAGADVVAHNIETVRRLTPALRDRRAGYDRSLRVLEHIAHRAQEARTKSGLMVGLGETRAEIEEALRDLHAAGVRIVTIGQYLRPTERAVPVERFVSPDEFDELAKRARAIGFHAAIAGPLVRSSYHAAEALEV
ncbi:lipoyl synthase [Candidatus Bipolaricaulota bacterium]|nr:lipoyl synthase [Candidatus Bipolaricaulota bacterium]